MGLHFLATNCSQGCEGSDERQQQMGATVKLRLRVKEIAGQKGMSMGKLERLADLSHPTIRDIFRNPYKEVTSTTLAKLATALGVSVADLFEEVSDDRTD